MEEIEKSNANLLTEIEQLQSSLNILLSSTLFNSISAKLSKSPEAPNIIEVIREIVANYVKSPELLSAQAVLEEYTKVLAGYYKEMIKVLDENITKHSSNFLIPELSKESSKPTDPASEKRRRGKQLFLKIQAMKTVADKFPSKKALDLLKDYVNQDHKLKMGLIILLALTFGLYCSKDSFLPKVWPKNMKEMASMIEEDGGKLADSINTAKLAELFDELLIPLITTKIFELKQAFQIDVIMEYFFLIGALLDLHDPTKMYKHKSTLVDLTSKSCSLETLFKMSLMLLCNSTHIETKQYFADILCKFTMKNHGIRTLVSTLMIAKWPLERAVKVVVKIVCSVPKGIEAKDYLANIRVQLFGLLEGKEALTPQRTEIVFSAIAALCKTYPEITRELVLDKVLTKIIEVSRGTRLDLSVMVNLAGIVKDIHMLNCILHRLDSIPLCWEGTLQKALRTILEIYAKGITARDNKLFLAEAKGKFEELFSLLCSHKMSNVEVVSSSVVQLIGSHLSQYKEMVEKWVEYLKSKNEEKVDEPMVSCMKYTPDGNLNFSRKKIRETVQSYFKETPLKETVLEENAVVLSALTRLCRKETTGNAKTVARMVFVELLKGLDETMSNAESVKPQQKEERTELSFSKEEVVQKTNELVHLLSKSTLLCPEVESEVLVQNFENYMIHSTQIILHALSQLAEEYEGILDHIEDYLSFIKTMLLSNNPEILTLSLGILRVALEQKVTLNTSAKLLLIEIYPRIKALSCFEQIAGLAKIVLDFMVNADSTGVTSEVSSSQKEDFESIVQGIKSKESYERAMTLHKLGEFIAKYTPLSNEYNNKAFTILKQQLRDSDSYVLSNAINTFKTLGDHSTNFCIESLLQELKAVDPLMATPLISETKKEGKATDPLVILYKTKISECLYKIAKTKGRMFHTYETFPKLLDALLEFLGNEKIVPELAASYLMIIAEVCKGFEEIPVNLHMGPIIRTALNFCRAEDIEIQKACFNIIYSVFKVWPEYEVKAWSKEVAVVITEVERKTGDEVVQSYCKSVRGLVEQRVKGMLGEGEEKIKVIYGGITGN